MGIGDAIFGSDPNVDWKHKRTGQQVALGREAFNFLQNLFSTGGWQNLLPTQQMMSSLSPEVWAGANYSIEQGANQLQERLMGSGIMGGSGGSALAKYYADAQPQVYGQLANMVGGAASYPYQIAAGLWPSTQYNTSQPIVSGGSSGFLGSAMQMMAPWAMSYLPWGNFGGFGGAGSSSPTTIGGQFANF